MGFVDSTEQNKFLIESRFEPCEGFRSPLWSSITSNWVEPSLNSTRNKIRLAYENRGLCADIAEVQYKTMSSFLSAERCIQLFKENIL